MSAAPDVLDMVRGEREDLADLLAALTPVQWSQPSLCSDWRVRDVAAHVISYDNLTAFRLVKRCVVDARWNMHRFNAIGIDDYADVGTDELVDLIRQRARPRGYMAALDGTIGLLDAMIHQQDIRRPLGLPRVISAERLRTALQRSLYVPLIRAAWRGRGLRLVAIDADWSHGSGAEVRAPGEALLLSLAGRRAAFGELTGPGAGTLIGRLGNPGLPQIGT